MKIYVKEYIIHKGTIRWQIHDFLFKMFALSLTINEIIAYQTNSKKFYLESEGQGQTEEKQDSFYYANHLFVNIYGFIQLNIVRVMWCSV